MLWKGLMMLVDWCRGKKRGEEKKEKVEEKEKVEGKEVGPGGEAKELPPLEQKEGLR